MNGDWEEAKDLVEGGQDRSAEELIGSATAATAIFFSMLGFLLLLRGMGVW